VAKKRNTTGKSSPSNRPILGLGVAGVLLVALFGLFLSMQDTQAAENSYPREISVDQTFEMRESGAFILDVRTPQEWDEYHIPGAVLVPLHELPNRLGEVPSDQDVVVVCRSGNRSAAARDILLEAGFEKVTSMGGGMLQWQAAGYPTVNGQ
jgi:rhodanese-related sulfurtransferase